MRSAGAVGIALFGMGGTGWLVSGVGSIVHPPQPPPGLEAHETHAAASLLGEFRTGVSAWLWVRTDLYLHNGVQMRPMSDAERQAGVTSSSAAKDENAQLHNENSVTTVIPPKERDFRGVFGDVERQIAAYKDMHNHKHNNPKLAMPLFRLMTWIDPQFIPGWTTGAAVLSWGEKTKASQARAVDYLLEGLKNNPESVCILADLGHFEVARLQDPRKATEYLERARALGSQHFHQLSEDDQDALQQTYRWLGLCYRDMKQPDAKRRVLLEGLSIFPEDTVMLSLYCPPPTVLTSKGSLRWFEELAADVKAASEPELR